MLFWCVILLWAWYYFDHPLPVHQIFVVMVPDSEVPFLADVIEARQHDELVVEHVFEAVAHKEVLDIKGYSTGGDADSVVENRAGLEVPFLKSLLLKFLLLKFLLLNMLFLMSLTLYPLNLLNTAIIHGHFPRTKMAARFGGQSHFPQCFALFGMCSGGREVCVILF